MNKGSPAYLSAILLLMFSVVSLAVLLNTVYAQDEIIVDGADYSSTITVQSPQDMPTADITRIVVEYADYATTIDVYSPDGLPFPSISRIIIEYADAAIQFDVQPPQGKPNPDISRIVIEYAEYATIIDTSRYYLGPQPMGENDTRPPEIGVLSRMPADPEVPEHQEVTVMVDITDADGGVKNATLQYSINDGAEWFDIPMTLNMTDYQNSLSVSYYGVIPGQTNCTWVRFRVIAYDYAWNAATKEGEAPYCPYHVVPEFPSIIILPLLMSLTLLAAAIAKKSHARKTTA